MVMKKELWRGMNAKIVGSGKETIVLAHGYGGDQSVWDKILPSLAEHYQVLVFDWCFSGAVTDPTLYDPDRHCCYDAFADDLIDLMDEMKLKSSVVLFVGHSMSGMIGCIASIKRPNLFHKLALVGSSPSYFSSNALKQVTATLDLCQKEDKKSNRLANMEDYEGGFEMSDIEQLLSTIENNYEQWASDFPSLVVDSSDQLSVQMFGNCLRRMRPEVALFLARTVFLSDHRDILEKVIIPCNIIQTRNDIVVPNSVTKFMQSKIKGKCEIDIIDTDGHFPQLTKPNEFLEVIDRILGC